MPTHANYKNIYKQHQKPYNIINAIKIKVDNYSKHAIINMSTIKNN